MTYFQEYYLKNRDRVLANNRKNQEIFYEKYPERMLHKNAKSRAKKNGVLFDIEVSDITIPDLCPVLRVPMVRNTRTAPSLDRIDPNKGYTKGNVQVMSKLANTMKNCATPSELVEFSNWVKQTYTI